MSAESAHLSTFGAETEVEIRLTSMVAGASVLTYCRREKVQRLRTETPLPTQHSSRYRNVLNEPRVCAKGEGDDFFQAFCGREVGII